MLDQGSNSLWTKNPALAWREIDGRTVIVSPLDSVLHELNETGSFIWNLLDGMHSAEAIAAQLALEYEVDPEVARADTEALVGTLAGQKLLLRAAAQPEGAAQR